jgi:hypothetical protein
MIAYDLQCAKGHAFEGWFEGQKAFEHQRRKELIACPVCNDTSVVVVPSTFGMKSGPPQSEGPEASNKPAEQMDLHKIMDFLEKHFDDVGSKFAREALKMHYGVSEKRNIRGTSTKTEEETLEKEGITFFKLPVPRLDS